MTKTYIAPDLETKLDPVKYSVDKVCPTCSHELEYTEALVLDKDGLTITGYGVSMKMPKTKFEIFEKLYADSPKVVSKENIFNYLYSLEHDCDWPEIKIIDVMMCNLRSIIRESGLEEKLKIETIWGVGYRMIPEIKHEK